MLSNNIDEPPPPYLTAGTEVSAKFKGAFCEAKITRVEKNVRCKITYKHNGQQATVTDDQIRSQSGQLLALNEFKPGITISILKAADEETSTQLALLNKVIDQSAYTVIFNDGDEKILRRSFIRFKGEKHYLDSETLNNAPLNNPEHFLYPIKHSSEQLSPKTKSPQQSQPPKRANITSDEESEEEQETKCEQPEIKKPKKAIIVKRRTISVEEPEHVAKESDESSTESDSSSSSDDYPSEVKDRFVAQLYKFMDDRGTPMNRLPTINCIDIDLHRFFIVVRRYGGYNKVCKLRNWIDVYKRLNLPNMSHSSNVINLKCAYKRYLQPFEDFYRKLGSTMCDLVSRHSNYNTNSAKRNTSDSHRSLQLFKNRVFTPNSTTQKKGLSKYKQKQAAASPSIDVSNTEAKLEPTVLIEQRKESIDSTIDIESTIKTEETNAMEQQTGPEEITLSSMVRNLNENFKKAKRQEKEKIKCTDDESQSDHKDTRINAIILVEESTTPSLKKIIKSNEPKLLLSKKKPSSSSVSSSSSSSSSSKHSDVKATNLIESNNNDFDDEDSLDESKPKRKVNRLSASGSDETQIILETKKKLGMKRKNSDNFSLNNTKLTTASSSNTETNDESENDKDNNHLQDTELNENEYKAVLSFNDLEVNKIVDVKYANGSQKKDYKAKIVQLNQENQTVFVHYLGWNTRYDEWVKLDRIKRMLNENFIGHKRRKSLKSKNQPICSPSSSSSMSSQLNESLNQKNKKSTDLVLLKKSERSSSSSTTSSICNDQKEDDLKLKTRLSLDKEPIELITEEIIETKDFDIKAITGDSLLSIKEEIIESEQTLIVITSVQDVFCNKVESEPELEQSNNLILTPCNITHTLSSKDNQENNKSQIKSPNFVDTSICQINQIDKVFTNQTNQINENHLVEPAEEDAKKKEMPIKLHSSNEENNKKIEPPCLDNCKYSFNLNDVNLLGKQRIRYIEEQMRLCREVYAKLKNEIAAIDRKKKKLKRSTFETNKSVYCNLTSSASSTNNDDSLLFTKHTENLRALKN